MKWENLRPLSPMFCDDMLDDYVDSKIAYEAWDGPVRRAVRLGCVGVTKQDIASFVISNAWRRSRLRRVFCSIERLHTRSLHAFITGHLYPDRLAGEKFRCKYPNKSCGLGMSAVKQWNLEEHMSNIVWSARFCGGWTPAPICLNSERQEWVSTHGERSAEYYFGPDLGHKSALKLFYEDVIEFWDRVVPLMPVYKEWFVGEPVETPTPQKRREIPLQNFPVLWSWSVDNGRICLVDRPYVPRDRDPVPVPRPRMVDVVDVCWDSSMPESKPSMVLESFEGFGCRAVRYKWESPEVVDHIGEVYELNGRYTVVGATTERTTFYTLRDFRLVSYQTHARCAAGKNVGVLKRGEIRKFFDHVAGMIGTRVLVGGRFTGVIVGFSGGLHTVEFDNGNTSTLSLTQVGWAVDNGEKCY